MIIDKTVKVKIVASNFSYFNNLGYKLNKLKRRNANPQIIDVKIEHLKPGSNIRVLCQCDLCSIKFTKRVCQRTDLCNHCRSVSSQLGNKNGVKVTKVNQSLQCKVKNTLDGILINLKNESM